MANFRDQSLLVEGLNLQRACFWVDTNVRAQRESSWHKNIYQSISITAFGLISINDFIVSLDVSVYDGNQFRKHAAMGCSRNRTMNDAGCQPVNKPCNPIVLLQLSTSNRAFQCYCNESRCNNPSSMFGLIFGGYLIIMIGIFGVIGNALAFGVLCSLQKKSNIDIILTGMFFGNQKFKCKGSSLYFLQYLFFSSSCCF